MQWLRNLLSPRPKSPAKVSHKPSNSFRPKVESLDDRIVPTVSTAVTNVGTFTLAVNTDNVLVAIDASGNQSPTSFGNVRTAQAFRSADGSLGADIVFRDGSWTHIDSGSPLGTFSISASQAQSQFGGLILDAGSAYNDAGQIRLEFIVSSNNNVDTNGNTFSDATGQVMEFSFANGLINTGLANALWVSAYNAADGTTGIALGQLTPGTSTTPGTLLSRKFDTVGGLVTLYNGRGDQFAGGAVVEYSQTTSLPTPGTLPGTSNSANRQVIIDVTFEGVPTTFDTTGATNDGGYALQFITGSSSTTGNIFGATTLSPNVTGIISANGTIKTGIEYPGATSAP